MTVIVCPPLAWTNIPSTGTDQIIEARERGLYVDTTAALNIANRASGYALAGGESMVISAARISAGVRVTPANDLMASTVRHSPV